jgi:hypothetical protein
MNAYVPANAAVLISNGIYFDSPLPDDSVDADDDNRPIANCVFRRKNTHARIAALFNTFVKRYIVLVDAKRLSRRYLS